MRLATLLAVLLAAALPAAAQELAPISPFVDCIGEKPDGGLFAWFGYGNPNIERDANGDVVVGPDGRLVPVEIPAGFENFYYPKDAGDPYDQGQTTAFYPGTNRFAHRLDIPAGFAADYWVVRTPGQSNHRGARIDDEPWGDCLYDSFVDISLAFELADPNPEVGAPVEGTITVRNDGTVTATTVHVQRYLPDGVTLAFADSTAADPNPSAGYVETEHWWTLDALAPGESQTLRVLLSADAETTVEGFFDAECYSEADADSQQGNRNDAEDDYAAFSFTTRSASGGGDGGLESDGSLATLLQRRDVERRLAAAEAERLGLGAAPPVRLADARAARAAAGKQRTDDLDLYALVPAVGPHGVEGFLSTPEDLLAITNATDILAADYLQPDGDRAGAVLAVMTPPGETYDHTKAICDRVKGSTLEAVRTFDYNGSRFVLLRIGRPDGSVEYAASFVAYPEADGYTVDARFRAEEYAIAPGQAGEVLNVQAWGSTPDVAHALVARVVDALQGQEPVEFRNWARTMPELPAVYAHGGRYESGTLHVRLVGTTDAPQAVTLTGTRAAVEEGERVPFERSVVVPPEGVDLAFETGPLFDVGFSVVADEVEDFVYLADGVWTYASGTEGDGLAYSVAAGSVAPEAGLRTVERDARLAGTTASWAGLFRGLQPGSRPVDLSAYDALAFRIAGTGRVQVVVEKTSTNGVEPFHAWLDLSPDGENVLLRYEDLGRSAGDAFTAEDVTLLAFYTYAEGSAPEAFEIAVSDMRFLNTAVVSNEADAAAPALALTVAPNPSRDRATARFALPEAADVSVAVFDLLGREVARVAERPFAAGHHELRLDAALPAGTYVIRLQAGAEAVVTRMTRVR